MKCVIYTSASKLLYSTLTGPVSRQIDVVFLLSERLHTIVDKSYLHHGLKNAILDLFWIIELMNLSEKAIVELACFIAAGCAMEVRLTAFPCRC